MTNLRFLLALVICIPTFGQIDRSTTTNFDLPQQFGSLRSERESATLNSLSLPSTSNRIDRSSNANSFSMESNFPEGTLDTKVDRNAALKNSELQKYTTNDEPKAFREGSKSSEGSEELSLFEKDQYIGDFVINSSFILLAYRDHGDVDGDIISVFHEGEDMAGKLFLHGFFKKIKLNLNMGFNKIEVKAESNGKWAPNTGHFVIIDDQGQELINQQWELAAGFKASFIFVRE